MLKVAQLLHSYGSVAAITLRRTWERIEAMPDPTPTPPPDPQKPKGKRGLVNKQHVEAIDKAGLVTTAAKKTGYVDLLAEREINAPFISQLETDIADCSERMGKASDFTSDIRVATGAEATAKTALQNAIKEIQAAAKQKYSRNTPQQMKDYFVGEPFGSSRSQLLQTTDSILAKLKTDTLPGITAAKVTGLKSLRDAYAAANAGQGDTQSKASTERNSVEDLVKSITNRRVQIQFAADGIWQASNKANAPIRREFQLPPDRAFSG